MKNKSLKTATKVVASDLSKLVTYPIFGGLSCSVKERLEKKLGKENFNSNHATIVNILSGGLAKAGLTCYVAISGNYGEDGVLGIIGISAGALAVIQDFLYRGICMEEGEVKNPSSLIGKIISLPVEGLCEYVESVKKRAGYYQ